MSQENVEIVRRIYEGTSARLEAPRELFSPDYEADASDVAPDFGVLRGFDAIQEAFRPYWETFDDFRVEIEEVVHADEKQVITRVRDGGRMKGSDSEVWNRFFHVWTFADGKVARFSIHSDRRRALEAVGLSEQDAHADS
jgi:ketosteroid isomerase-like protein